MKETANGVALNKDEEDVFKDEGSPDKTCLSKVLYKIQKWKVLFSIILYVLYLVLGGVCFHAIEGSNEQRNQQEHMEFNSMFLENFTCITKDDLQELVQVIISAYKKGIFHVNATATSNWDIPGSLFFSTTVLTTIGYGNITPDTGVGRIFFGFYALIGIPLFLYTTAGIGQSFQRNITKVRKRYWVFECLRSRRKLELALFNITIVIIGAILFLFLPSLVFLYTQPGWGYYTSLYYSFVTLTTIGFGDYVAESNSSVAANQTFFRLFLSAWILLGLTWMATIITMIQDVMSKKASHLHESIRKRVSSSVQSKGSTSDGLPPKINDDNGVEVTAF